MSGAALSTPEGGVPRGAKHKNVAGVVASSGLPAELGQRVLDVTAKCRLWNRERVAVAYELVDHFRDGLESGAAPAELLGSFGEAKSSAKLITRAMRRKRPLWWQLYRRAWLAAGALLIMFVLLWGVLLVRLYTGRPTIARNIALEYNQRALAAPESQRAWPGVRSVAVTMPLLPEALRTEGTTWPEMRPGTNEWRIAADYLRQAKPSLDELRRLTLLPVLGRAITVEPDTGLVAASGNDPDNLRHTPEPRLVQKGDDVQAVAILLPHLATMRSFGRLLFADVRLARQEGDGTRVADDLRALLRLAEWSSEDRLLISQLVAIAIASMHDQLVREMLWESPQLFSDVQLKELAHRIASARVVGGVAGGDMMDATGESMLIDDVLQRTFTDDGHGDGRVTPQFFTVMKGMYVISPPPQKGFGEQLLDLPPLQALDSALIGSRRQWKQAHDAAINRLMTRQRMPLLERRRDTVDPLEGASIGSAGRQLIGMLIPAIDKAGESATYFALDRDATVAAIALELFKREQGRYPKTLAELTPRYLPSVPIDRLDGQPMRYRVSAPYSNGRPVLYSIGGDGQDDGGPTYTFTGQEMNARHGQYAPKGGDYIMWPPLKGPPAPESPSPAGG